MTIYLAAPFEHLLTMRTLRESLVADGVAVNSRWLSETPEENMAVLSSSPTAKELGRVYALRDLEDIDAADVVVVYNPVAFKNAGTGGRHVELGYAIGRHKTVILYNGYPSNVFHYLVLYADTYPALVEMLTKIAHVMDYNTAKTV